MKAILGIFSALFIVVAYQNCGEGFSLNPMAIELLSESPRIVITSGPQTLSNLRADSIVFEARTNASKSISQVLCSLNQGPFEACESPVDFLDLADGGYNFDIVAIDSQGYESGFSLSWTVDATAPIVLINTLPANVTGSADNQVTFTATDNLSGVQVTECSFQGADFAPCVSPLLYAAQDEGDYSLLIRTRDLAQNISAIIPVSTATWQVDLTAPSLLFVATPLAISNVDTATFQISATDNNQALDTFECQLDNGGFAACVNPVNFAGLAEGNHSFQFRARDLANNLSEPATFNWLVDTVAPNIVIANGPDLNTAETNATFTFSVIDSGSGVNVVSIMCQLDAGAPQICSSPFSYVGLALGDHSFTITAADVAANPASITYNWNVGDLVNANAQGPLWYSATDLALNSDATQAFAVDLTLDAIFRIDILTGNRTIVSDSVTGVGPNFRAPNAIAINANATQAFVIDGGRAIVRVDLANGNRTIVSAAGVGVGQDFIGASNIALNADATLAFIADRQTIIRVDLATGDRTVVTSLAVGAGPNLDFLRSISINADATQAFAVGRGVSVFRVDLITGDRTIVSDPDVGNGPNLVAPSDITVNANATLAFILDNSRQGIYRIDLATGDRAVISSFLIGSGPNFNTPRGISINANSTLAWVTDPSADVLFQVDLSNGTRSILSRSNIGSGTNIFNPSDISLNADNSQAYVVDVGLDAIFRVDLVNGNRTQVSGGIIGAGPSFQNINSIALNPGATQGYVIDTGLDALFRVDLSTGDRTIVSDAVTGSGPVHTDLAIGLALNPTVTEAYVLDTTLNALLSIDLTTGARTILSDSQTGLGPDFNVPREIFVNTGSQALVINRSAGSLNPSLYLVDLISGNRSRIPNAFDSIVPRGIATNANSSLAYTIDESNRALVQVDLNNGNRTVISSSTVGSGPPIFAATGFFAATGLSLSANGTQIYMGDGQLDAILRIDLTTGNRVVVSK